MELEEFIERAEAPPSMARGALGAARSELLRKKPERKGLQVTKRTERIQKLARTEPGRKKQRVRKVPGRVYDDS